MTFFTNNLILTSALIICILLCIFILYIKKYKVHEDEENDMEVIKDEENVEIPLTNIKDLISDESDFIPDNSTVDNMGFIDLCDIKENEDSIKKGNKIRKKVKDANSN